MDILQLKEVLPLSVIKLFSLLKLLKSTDYVLKTSSYIDVLRHRDSSKKNNACVQPIPNTGNKNRSKTINQPP